MKSILLFILLTASLLALDFDKLVTQIKVHEGFSSTIYKDRSGLAIGYGTNLASITKAEAHLLLIHRLSNRITTLSQYPWYRKLSDTRKSVIISMAYQLGPNGLLKFKKMIWALNRGYYNGAANQMIDSLWYQQSGNRSKELVQIMKEGVNNVEIVK